ncbi:MAG TPA: NAD(P)-dependent alcohol dehydrogenase [Pyrinomonadaceae bacterium]|nr:NAD(P)-dependent alcohol dehydrogenase [Pyrinomonadaceae bacterium]
MGEITRAYAAGEPRGKFERFDYDAGELGGDQVDIKVLASGICHSDLSMLNNDWGMTQYPFVGGHEAVGTVIATGANVRNVEVGDTVGLGWNSGSCNHCDQCINGYQINCRELEQTIVARHGGFADRVRCNWEWAVKLPDGMDASKAGPLFCGGITVFNPFVQDEIKPTDRVGVVGIGGLGHLALQFADKWGCEVTAFTSNAAKTDELRSLGADYVVGTRDDEAIKALAGRFDMILVTVNVPLNWDLYFSALAPKGKLHVVGAVLDPIPVSAFSLIMNQKSLTGTATGSPGVVAKMLEFCARHKIEAVTETFPMSRINNAFEHLESGKARYRIVLENDFD